MKILTSSIVWILAIISILIVQVAGGFVLVAAKDNQDLVVYAIMIVAQIINVVIVRNICKKSNFISPYKIAKVNAKNAIISALLALATFVGMYLASLYVFDLFAMLGVENSEIRLDGIYLIFAIIATVILAPIGEELVYRYVICGALQQKGKVLAVVISALCFAFMHMSPMQTVYQLFLGVVLALIVIKTNNVVYAMITHATSNLIAITLSFINIPAINLYHPLTIVLAVVLLGLGVLAVIFLLKITRKEESKNTEKEIDKKQNGTATIIYIIGFIVCLFIWVLNFF